MTILLVFIYQMESWFYKELNQACSYKDRSKVDSLGPISYAISEIIYAAQYNRDKTKYDCSKLQNLWFTRVMTSAEINDYQAMVGKKEIDCEDDEYDATIRLFGYT